VEAVIVARAIPAMLLAAAIGCAVGGGAAAPAQPGGQGGAAAPGGEARPAMDGAAHGGSRPADGGTPFDAVPGRLHTSAGVPVPAGWTQKALDRFGTALGSTVSTFAELHAKYYEGMYYNRDARGLVKIPNVVINREQETYVHFEDAIAWAADHLTIQARGRPDGSIASGELVSVYTARSFCGEAHYRVPSEAGAWPAFWFYAATTGGDKSEIDVEQPITPHQGVTSVSLYNHPSQRNVIIADPAFTTRWMTWTKATFDGSASAHRYTVCYDDAAATITRYIDGSLIYTATFKWNESLGGTGQGPDPSAIVNLAVGGSWPGNVANPSGFRADLDLYSVEWYGP
jgi:hypothetical protein